MLPRFVREIFNPSLRCERLGHAYVDVKTVIRKRTKEQGTIGYGICDDYYATIPVCSRCGNRKKPINQVYKTYWTTVSMPDHMWKTMDRNGYVVIE